MVKEIHIFDMDDTLLVTPNITDFTKFDDEGKVVSDPDFEEKTLGHNNHSFFRKVKKMFFQLFSKEIYLKKQGDFIVMYDHKDERPLPSYFITHIEEIVSKIENEKPSAIKNDYGIEKHELKDMSNWFEVKDNLLILIEPRGFHSYQETIGMEANDPILEIYHKVRNKAILTGRNSNLHSDITRKLLHMGIEFPNFGLYCFDNRYSKNIKDFKGGVVNELIGRNGFEIVHMYEDKPNWLKHIELAVKDKNPQVEFIGHHIRNIKDRRSL